jgi:hypothetical protein
LIIGDECIYVEVENVEFEVALGTEGDILDAVGAGVVVGFPQEDGDF